MTVKQGLQKIRKLISRGWCRGAGSKKVRGKMHYCLVGACSRATNESDDYFAIRQKLTDIFGDVVNFNDSCKDKRIIIRKLDKAIKEL